MDAWKSQGGRDHLCWMLWQIWSGDLTQIVNSGPENSSAVVLGVEHQIQQNGRSGISECVQMSIMELKEPGMAGTPLMGSIYAGLLRSHTAPGTLGTHVAVTQQLMDTVLAV